MGLETLRLKNSRRFENSGALLLPVLTAALASLIAILPVPIPGYAGITPAFALMAVFHWTLYRPELLPSAVLFLIGVGEDLVSGAPLGVTALLLLLARWVVLRTRKYFQNRLFPFVWTGFALLTAGAMLFLWTVNSLLAWETLGLHNAMFRWLLTVALFPLASFLLGRAQRTLLAAG
jgi:rod shape-determining protein MreD